MVRILLFLLGLVVPLGAQQAPVVPVDLEFAVSGGGFQADSVWGRYRVLVLSGGSDHIVSDFHLQWVRDPSREDTATVVSSVPINELNGVWRAAGAPVIRRTAAGTTVLIDLVDSHGATPARRHCVVTPRAPSKYTIRCDR
jgi:hypothetical protein